MEKEITNQDMLKKTFSTFHASNVLLHQQYHEHEFKKYSKLIFCLLVGEQNNELLIKNHLLHPTKSIALFKANGTALPKANATSYHRCEKTHAQNNQQQDNNFKRHKANKNSSSNKKHEEIVINVK